MFLTGRTRLRGLLRAIALTVATLVASSAGAHGRFVPGDTSGVPIPNLTHGEMAVLIPYRADIMRLARAVRTEDAEFRTLERFAAIQYANCLWGLVPGSITDEASPFNGCSHAYLAAVKELLVRMHQAQLGGSDVGGLVSRIDAEMTLAGAALIGCRYSGDSFNTAEILRPEWQAVPTHLPSLLGLSASILLLPASVFALQRLRRSAAGTEAGS
jgi:hypothetical protein